MAAKAWHKTVEPREDLREGRPLDASEFAVHLDMVRDRRGPDVYFKPEQFFERTYLTDSLVKMAAESLRRLSGIQTETNAVFNLATQFGGGKTHALTLLYHLAAHGPAADHWQGVHAILEAAQIKHTPKAEVAVFVGTEFDSLTGRGGDDGTPKRFTPWGEIAWQLGGEESFDVVRKHDAEMMAPGGDVIRAMLPKDRPCLILMDELMNYVSTFRKMGLATQLYNFLHKLSETARGEKNVVLAVSIPASELEMSAEDAADFQRFKKLLDRLGEAVMMGADEDAAEIIRRRLFEWGGLGSDAKATVAEYAEWVGDNSQSIPGWFTKENARDAFAATYPFHPSVISVFERKWQALPRFQRTRGMLRLLALWVSRAYQDGYKNLKKDAMIHLGTAPIEDPLFRSALFEQLDEQRLEVPLTTDIAGRKDSHSARLDREASDAIKKARLHQQAATTIFFESNGGTTRNEATQPEIRLAIGRPDLDIANLDTVLEGLAQSCYYLIPDGNKYRFSLKENLNKRFADRRASIKDDAIEERVREEIQKTFDKALPTIGDIDRRFFPERSSDLPDRPVLTFAIVVPDRNMSEEAQTMAWIEKMTREAGNSSRTFKSALVWCVAEDCQMLREEARKVLAWDDLDAEAGELLLDEKQRKQLAASVATGARDMREAVWRSYKVLVLLSKDNTMRRIDLGLVHSSAASGSPLNLYIQRLRQDGDLEPDISPRFLERNWPPALEEWSTKQARDAFYASPQFPRLLRGDAIKDTIARGATEGVFAYVAKTPSGRYDPAYCGTPIDREYVEISDDVFIVKKQTYEAKVQMGADPEPPPKIAEPGGAERPAPAAPEGSSKPVPDAVPIPDDGADTPVFRHVAWQGEIPHQKWMQFYTRALTRFVADRNVKLRISVEVDMEGALSATKLADLRTALRELQLDDNVDTEE